MSDASTIGERRPPKLANASITEQSATIDPASGDFSLAAVPKLAFVATLLLIGLFSDCVATPLLVADEPQPRSGVLWITVTESETRVTATPFFQLAGDHPHFDLYNFVARSLSEHSECKVRLESIERVRLKFSDTHCLWIRIENRDVTLARGKKFPSHHIKPLAEAFEAAGEYRVRIVPPKTLEMSIGKAGAAPER